METFSTRTLTNASGSMADYMDYLPFGELIAGNYKTSYLFIGQERGEVNLDHFGARYYSSQYGRFMTPDWSAKPTGVPYAQLGDSQSLNLYSYVRNNPLSHVDPDGHYIDAISIWVCAAAAAAAIVGGAAYFYHQLKSFGKTEQEKIDVGDNMTWR